VTLFSSTVRPFIIAAAIATAALPARAQPGEPSGARMEPGTAANAKPGLLNKIGIDQRLNEQVPLDLVFKDESGRELKLGELFGKRPVVLALVYYECPMLCTQVLNGAVSALSILTFDVGKEYDVIAVSINPKETPALAAEKKKAYVQRYKRPQTAAGWHFLTGDEQNIQKLAAAVGFRYAFDPDIQQYAHGAAIEILTPRAVVSKYFYGIEFSPRDLRFGLIDASDERIGTVVDNALMLCYHYDPATGKYGAAAIDAIRVGGIATLTALLSFMFISLRRERASSHHDASV
jgi:protein SCO1/2